MRPRVRPPNRPQATEDEGAAREPLSPLSADVGNRQSTGETRLPMPPSPWFYFLWFVLFVDDRATGITMRMERCTNGTKPTVSRIACVFCSLAWLTSLSLIELLLCNNACKACHATLPAEVAFLKCVLNRTRMDRA